MVRVLSVDQKAWIIKHGKKTMKKSSVNKQPKKINDFCITFIRCACENELLVVRYDKEWNTIELSMYETQYSFNNKMTFWQKVRYIYRLLKTGQPYTDQILLKKEQIEELKGFLNKI